MKSLITLVMLGMLAASTGFAQKQKDNTGAAVSKCECGMPECSGDCSCGMMKASAKAQCCGKKSMCAAHKHGAVAAKTSAQTDQARARQNAEAPVAETAKATSDNQLTASAKPCCSMSDCCMHAK